MSDEIGIIGYSARLPGAPTAEDAWRVLAEGRCVVTSVPEDRWSSERYLDPSGKTPGRAQTRYAAILDDLWEFDPHFFGISPKEARIMDPQQRLLMETVSHALDHAGVDPSALDATRTGVYIGSSLSDHSLMGAQDVRLVDARFSLGNAMAVLSNRMSWHWNFQGPSLTVDTACSSGLLALDLARDAIRKGQIDTAVVGAVNALISPISFTSLSTAGLLSPTGRCHTFGANADGYVRAEGVVVFVLQRASVARAAGRRVRSVLAGSGVATAGRTISISVPSSDRQADLITRVMDECSLRPDDITFVEAHGTGTPVGDPQEARAIGQTLGQKRSSPLPIGSSKSNFGHLEPAAGLVGLLKAQLALENGHLPATINAETLNPNIAFDDLNLQVARDAGDLPEQAAPWHALINSFGFGGVNVTAVLRQAPAPEPETTAEMPPSLLLTAGSQTALRSLVETWKERAEAGGDDLSLAVANANRHLGRHRQRLCAPAGSAETLATSLTDWLEGQGGPAGGAVHVKRAAGTKRKVAFVFCGNGAIWEGMHHDLAAGDAVYRQSFAQVSALFGEIEGARLEEYLSDPGLAASLDRATVAQPLLYATQIALVEALCAAGVRPDIALGHSAGEIPAAVAAGRLTVKEGAHVIAVRSRLSERLRDRGTMASAATDADKAGRLIDELGLPLEIAAENSPANVTISGPAQEIDRFVKAARKHGVACKRLLVPYPYHSRFIDEISAEIAEGIGTLPHREGEIPFISGWRGDLAEDTSTDAAYWVRSARQPVRFRKAIDTAEAAGAGVFLEIGPRPVLQRDLRDTLATAGSDAVPLPTMPGKKIGPHDASLFARGVVSAGGRVDEDRVLGNRRRFTADLPPYPFDHNTYRLDLSEGLDLLGTRDLHPFLGWRERDDTWQWRGSLSLSRMPWLADHKLDDRILFPGTGIIEILAEAARQALGHEACDLRNLEILRSVEIDEDRVLPTRVTFENTSRRLIFEVESAGGWSVVALCTAFTPNVPPDRTLTISADRDGEEVYEVLRRSGIIHGESFSKLARYSVHENEVIEGTLENDEAPWFICMDALMLISAAVARARGVDLERAYAPRRFGRLQIHSRAAPVSARITIDKETDGAGSQHGVYADRSGNVVMEVEDQWGQVLSRKTTDHHDLWDEELIALPGGKPPLFGTAGDLGYRAPDAPLNDLDLLRESLGNRLAWDALAPMLAGGASLGQDNTHAFGILEKAGALTLSDEGLPVLPDTAPWPEVDRLIAALWKTAPTASLELRAALRAVGKTPFEPPRTAPSLCRAAVSALESAAPGAPRTVVLAGLPDQAVIDCALARAEHLTLVAPDEAAMQRLHTQFPRRGPMRFAPLYDPSGQMQADLVIGIGLSQCFDVRAQETLAGLVVPGGEMLLVEEASDAFAVMTGRHRHADAIEKLTAALGRGGLSLDLRPSQDNIAVLIGLGTAPARAADPVADFDVIGESSLAHSLRAAARAACSASTPRANGASDHGHAAATRHAPDLSPKAEAAPSGAARLHVLEAGASDREAALARAETLQKIIASGGDGPVWIVDPRLEDAEQLTGWRRVAVNENNMDIRTASVAPDVPPDKLLALLSHTREHEVILGPDGVARSPRIRRVDLPEGPQTGTATKLHLTRKTGGIVGHGWRRAARPEPQEGEIEIEVSAAGLNYRDVMLAQGLLPPDIVANGGSAGAIGLECAGTVARAADGSRFRPGDRVMAICAEAFASHVTVPDHAAVRLPEGVSPEEAAALPVIFQTADYALNEIARLGPGETVLIHGGAGGVGLAAIQIAAANGATILATAGTEDKRHFLRLLGVSQVFDSRTLEFEDAVLQATGGRGVDVVLNSLSGEAMERSLACLAPFGRFIELGKRDYVANTLLGLRPMSQNLSYHGVDLDQLALHRPEVALRCLERVRAGFADGKYNVPPIELFPAENLSVAMRQMQRSRHLGKIVLRAPKPPAEPSRPAQTQPPDLSGNWLIAGGTRGFGLATAEWLLRKGARKLWLVGLRGYLPEADRARLERLGARVEVCIADITDPEAMEALGRRLEADPAPLHGIVHSAMILQDDNLSALDPERITQVLAPKIDGAHQLAALADRMGVRHFWLYSSVTARVGSIGQAPYAAANRALEALARRRAEAGKPVLCVAWGALGDTGHLSQNDDLRRHIGTYTTLLNAEQALDRLWQVLTVWPDRSWISIVPANWGRLATLNATVNGPLFELVDTDTESLEDRRLDLRAMIAEQGLERTRKEILALLVSEAAKILHLAPSEVDPIQPLDEMGFDSLAALSLKLAIEEKSGVSVPAADLRVGLNLSHLVNGLLAPYAEDEDAADYVERHVGGEPIDEVFRTEVADIYEKIATEERPDA